MKGGNHMKKMIRFALVSIFLLFGQAVVQIAPCPYCGENATFTGGRKLVGTNQGSVCQYSHLYIGSDGKSVKHTFWQNCEGK
jgi:hypothetical protein